MLNLFITTLVIKTYPNTNVVFIFSVFDVESTVTEETKIKPVPFFSLKFRDYLNLPENFNVTVSFVELERRHESYGTIVRGVESTNLTVSREVFRPDTMFEVSVSSV